MTVCPWFRADASLGGSFGACPAAAQQLAGIVLVDSSIELDLAYCLRTHSRHFGGWFGRVRANILADSSLVALYWMV